MGSRGPHTVGMTRRAPIKPGNYTLGPETWTEIVEAYRDGATARELAVKWKVAPGSVYYHACKDGWSKKKNGDDRARAHARALEADETRRAEAAPDNAAARLFDGIELDEVEGDPGALAKAAILASGRAMKGRLWAEAKALAGLAEAYARLSERTIEEVYRPSPQDMAAQAFLLEKLGYRDPYDEDGDGDGDGVEDEDRDDGRA